MKRIYTYIYILMFMCYIASAQTQQGIVKTRGRMIDGQLVAGSRLDGAVITLNFGNSLVSDKQGAFSFAVPSSKSFSLVEAKKQGYILSDADYTNRSFTYSPSDPFFIILEDEKQRQADINAATRKIRKTLIAQLEKLEEEIETLKEANKISEEEYQNRLKHLYDSQSKSEELVKEMAERYATTDYDQLDDFNRQVQLFIEEGELQKADSMIQSKGNIEGRITDYHKIIEANKEERKKLERSELGAANTYKDLSQDLYRIHEIFLQKFQQDSALYYLKLRADLDSTNINAQKQYADLCYEQDLYKESEERYKLCLTLESARNDSLNIAFYKVKLGGLYLLSFDYKKAEVFLQEALMELPSINDNNKELNLQITATTQLRLAVLYNAIHDYSKAFKYNNLAINNFSILCNLYTNIYRIPLAKSQNAIGRMYFDIEDYSNSEKYLKMALENNEKNLIQNPETDRGFITNTYYYLGILYSKMNDFENAEKYHLLALNDCELLYKQNPENNRRKLAEIQLELGTLYSYLEDNEKSDKYYKLAFDNYKILSQRNPDAYTNDLAWLSFNYAIFLHLNLQDYEKSEIYYGQALEKFKYLYDIYPDTYREGINKLYINFAYLYADSRRFERAVEMVDKAIMIWPDNVNFYDCKGEIYLMQNKNKEALEMWNKVLEIKTSFLEENPEGTFLSNKLKELELIK